MSIVSKAISKIKSLYVAAPLILALSACTVTNETVYTNDPIYGNHPETHMVFGKKGDKVPSSKTIASNLDDKLNTTNFKDTTTTPNSNNDISNDINYENSVLVPKVYVFNDWNFNNYSRMYSPYSFADFDGDGILNFADPLPYTFGPYIDVNNNGIIDLMDIRVMPYYGPSLGFYWNDYGFYNDWGFEIGFGWNPYHYNDHYWNHHNDWNHGHDWDHHHNSHYFGNDHHYGHRDGYGSNGNNIRPGRDPIGVRNNTNPRINSGNNSRGNPGTVTPNPGRKYGNPTTPTRGTNNSNNRINPYNNSRTITPRDNTRPYTPTHRKDVQPVKPRIDNPNSNQYNTPRDNRDNTPQYTRPRTSTPNYTPPHIDATPKREYTSPARNYNNSNSQQNNTRQTTPSNNNGRSNSSNGSSTRPRR